MSENEINLRLLEHFGAVESPFTRWKMNFYARSKRASWRFVVHGTERIKRVFDVLCSAFALLMLSPLFVVLAIWIKLEDGGPIFFGQKRVGKWGQEFKMFKFRSMCVNAEKRLEEVLKQNEHSTGVTFKIKRDPRITRIGKYLRRFSLDELPQFYNVFIGNMSLVGPRPPLPREVALYTPADRRRLEVTPGLTCLWQIGGRANIDFPEQVQLDVDYIESQSFWLDLRILLKTVPAVLLGRGAC